MTGNYVYVIRYGDLDHKVGFSVRPTQRLGHLRDTSPLALTLVRTWHRPHGDAETVERVAHRLLATWRLDILGQMERFEVNARVACRAVETAGFIVREEGRAIVSKDARRAVQMALTIPAPASDGVFRIGYVCGERADVITQRSRALILAGVPHTRIYADRPIPGPGLASAVKAIRQGDRLVLAGIKALPPELHDRVMQKGAAVTPVACVI